MLETVTLGNRTAAERLSCVGMDNAAIPSLFDIERCFSCTSKGRSCGEDGLPDELLAVASARLARLFYPLYLKSWIRCETPIYWRGGALVNLYKGKGDIAECANSRGICVEDGLAKRHSRLVRESMLNSYNRYVRETQCGGVANRGTDYAAHYVKSLLEVTHIRRLCVALVFIDVIGAFDALIRSIIVMSLQSHEQLRNHLSAFCPDENIINEVMVLSMRRSVLAEAGVSPHVEIMTSLLHEHTWFATQGTPSIVRTQRGSRPGNCLGDILFNFLIARVMGEVEQRLIEADMRTPAPQLHANSITQSFRSCSLLSDVDTPRVLDIDYCDDCVVPVCATSALEIIDKLPIALRIIHSVFSRFGLPMNFKAGKTEVMLAIHGTGAKAVQKEIFKRRTISFSPHDGAPDISVRIVDSYKHMGVYVDKNGSQSCEISVRTANVYHACSNLRSCTLRSPAVSVDVKLSLVRSLLHSKLFYCSQLWSKINSKDIRKLTACYIKTLRSALGLFNISNREHVTDREILRKSNMPEALSIVRTNRLRYLRRLILSDQRSLIHLVVATSGRNQSWLATVISDLAWMKRCLPFKLASLPDPCVELSPWLDLSKSPSWMKLVKKAVDVSTTSYLDMVTPQLDDESEAHHVFCYECGQSFHSFRLLRNHCHRAHGYKSPTRAYLPSNECLACLTLFGSRDRAVQHLMTRHDCLAILQSVYAPLPCGVISALDKQATEERRKKALVAPAVKYAGPRIHMQMASTGLRSLH